ncbi:tRNA (adenosine(37)-N6)-dimethylallyltransferase MiaA [Flavilitoribacter nigricans]|uniref:tRNA (adenosine(37)-N6)-dimethylallyltransferase MiaA n=1 Tax=Flavilitoribacter nigricans TaxID=70997 RepID=UPI001EED9CCB|nr:tRNA (adenosine(37)-N6)-dimethylallyltransferase MiaA [Flavilitoribacter nigricans]
MEHPEHKQPKKYLLVVGGATASGKTGFAIQLARHFQTEIVSADSRQFYREMQIGTAKPTPEELSEAPHHLIGHISIETAYSVGDYEQEALRLLDDLYEKHKVVILCGGSGLFIKALCEGLDQFPEVPAEITAELQAAYEEHGLAFLQSELQAADPEYYGEVDQQNPRRLLRALSVIRASGKPFSSFRKQQPKSRDFTPVYLQIDWPREQLYARINQRVDLMLAAGLVEEARQLYAYRHLQALQTVGYQELFDHFSGLISLEEAVELIKRNSRRYAKRQLTWFRRDGFWEKFHPDDLQKALHYIGQKIEG